MDYIPLQDYDPQPSHYHAQLQLPTPQMIKPDQILLASTRLPEPEQRPKRQVTPMKDPLIEKIQEQMSGKTFDLVVREEKLNVGSNVYTIPAYGFKDSEKITAQLKALANTENIRVFFPGTMGTQDFVADRVNFVFDDKGVFQRCFKG